MKRHNRFIDFFKVTKDRCLSWRSFFSGLRPFLGEGMEGWRAGQKDGKKVGVVEGWEEGGWGR